MSSLLFLDQREARAPDADVLPDGRKRLTRYLKVNSRLVVPAELGLPVGSADLFPNAPTGWTGLYLTYYRMTDQMPPGGKDSQPVLVLTFEQISATGETQLGGPVERVLEDGRIGYDLTYLEFSTNAFNPGTVGSSTAPNDASAYLQNVDTTNDGTVRKITRTYVYAGELAYSTETKNNGSLSIVTITSAKTVPSTPSGYTLIGQPIQNPNGLPIYTYTYAKGNGQVSYDQEYHESTNQGGAGITITTIRYFTASTVSSNPTTGPGGSTLIKLTYEDADGYRVWTAVYAAGSGTVSSATETRNGGKLVIYKITALGTAPSAPASTIGGTVTQISAATRNGSGIEDGIVIYDYAWAEGEGEISQDVDYLESVN